MFLNKIYPSINPTEKPSLLLKLPNYEENKLVPEVTCLHVSVLYGLLSAVNSIKVRPPHKPLSLPTYFIYGWDHKLVYLNKYQLVCGSSRFRSSVSIQGFKSNLALSEHRAILRAVSFSKWTRVMIHLLQSPHFLFSNSQHHQAYVK